MKLVKPVISVGFVFCLISISMLTNASTPLIEATKNQNRTEVEKLLDSGVSADDSQGDGATAMHWAAYRNDAGIADSLLKHGANPNSSDDHGVTPLSLAVLNANLDLVKLLLSGGANPNLRQRNGQTALMVASRVGKKSIVEALLNAGANVNDAEKTKKHTALMMAVAGQHKDVTKLLIERGADVRAKSINSFTPLLFAAQQGNIELGRLLLAFGADVNESAPDGISGNTNARYRLIPDTSASALLVAIDSSHEEMAIFLLENGANPTLDGAGRTALHSAVQHEMHDLVKTLLNHGADPNAKLTRNMPVFSRVILIDNGLAVNKLGATTFFLAAGFNDIRMMDLLL